MQIDAPAYFAAIDEARDPAPVMSREEAVMVAILSEPNVTGQCWACGADISQKTYNARWCDECLVIREQIRKAVKHQRARGTRAVGICVDCGKPYDPEPSSRSGPRCEDCAPLHKRKRQAEWARAKRARLRDAE